MRIAGLAGLLVISGCSEAAEEVAISEPGEIAAPAQSETALADDASAEVETPVTENAPVPVAAALSDRPSSTCGASEEKVFSCTMKSGKQASICVAGERDGKFAQYRFGPAEGAAELVWPASADQGQLAFKSVPYSGGGEAQMSFTNGDTTYVVFSRMIRTNFVEGEPNNPAIEDGLMVVRGGTALGELTCAGEAETPINYDLADRYAKPTEEMFYAE